MRSLKNVVDALRREILSALEQGAALPDGARLEADRVTATLHFRIDEGRDLSSTNVAMVNGTEVGKPSNAPMHSLTIEFRYIPSEAVHENASNKIPIPASTPVQLPTAAKLEGDTASYVTEQLSAVFGAPGFDSSARATVFREALETLSDDEATKLLAALRGAPVGEKDATIKRAMALLQRVSHSGPSGVEKGKAILADVFSKHSPKSVVALVAAIWKSQDDWMR